MREQSSVDRRIHVQMKHKVILKEAKAAQAAWRQYILQHGVRNIRLLTFNDPGCMSQNVLICVCGAVNSTHHQYFSSKDLSTRN